MVKTKEDILAKLKDHFVLDVSVSIEESNDSYDVHTYVLYQDKQYELNNERYTIAVKSKKEAETLAKSVYSSLKGKYSVTYEGII